MEPEKGFSLTYSPSPASRRRFGSPERRVHPAPTSSHNGTHNALTLPRSENHYEHHAPFHLEHCLHQDHPLRHPNAVHWRSAYSVISLHRKYKELHSNGGVPVRDPTRGSDNGGDSDGLLSNGGENPAEVKRLAEENLQLKLELDQKTKEVEEIKIENEETKQQLEQKTKELEEKDHAMEQLQTKLDDVACQLKRSAENSAALQSKMSEAGIDVDSLMEQLAEMQAFRETLIRKAASRWLMSGVASTFNNWKSNVNEIVSNRRLIARFSARWSRSGLHGSFVRWHDMARTECRNRAIIKKFAARFSNQIVSKSFHKWQHLVQDNNRLQRLQQKVAQRFMQQKLSAAFHGWYNNVHEILYNRSVLLKFSMRMKNSHLISSFAAWHHYAEERVHVRHTMVKYMNAIVRAGEVQAIDQWKKYSQWYERHQNEENTHTLTHKIHSLEHELHTCQTELEEFRTIFAAKRDKFVAALKARVEHERARTAFNRWEHLAHSRNSARRTINRLMNKQLASAWHSWQHHDSILKEENAIRAMANAERQRERERKKVVLNRTLKHMQQLKYARTFRTWQENVAEIVQTRYILNRFVARWKNQELHQRFVMWKDCIAMYQHQRALAWNVMNRLARKYEVAAWHQWIQATEQLRSEDMEAQEAERKKSHDDLVLERFVRRWKNQELHHRFSHWRNNWRHEKHTRFTQNELAKLRSEYEQKIGGMQAARDAEREFRVRKTLAAWLNNTKSHCFHRWRELISRMVRERNVVAKFVLQWQKAGLVAAYRTWVYKVVHARRSRRIVANMTSSRGKRMVAKTFHQWHKLSEETAKNRRLLKRFGLRLRNGKLNSVWLAWHDFMDFRSHARGLVTMMLSRYQNQNISKGFRAWRTYCFNYDTWKEAEKVKSEAMLERHRVAATELQAKQASAGRMLRHMMQRNLALMFRTWQENVEEIVRVRTVMNNMAVRMTKSGMVKAFSKWMQFFDDRALARKVLMQLLHHKLASAWKTWIKYNVWISKWTADAAVKKVEELTLALDKIRKRSVRTLLWDRYKEMVGTAMHAWYITMVHDRENEHTNLEHAEHQQLEEALAREAAEHAKYEEAIALGADKEVALANLEKGLEQVQNEVKQKDGTIADLQAHPKKGLGRALISSAWHKHKSQVRAKEQQKKSAELLRQRNEAMQKLDAEEHKHSPMSAWAIARAGVRGIKGTSGRTSPAGVRSSSPSFVAGKGSTITGIASAMLETGGRAVQRKLEEINDVLHAFTTATTIFQQCTLLRDISCHVLRADNVDMFIKEENSFWTTSDVAHDKKSWPLTSKGGMVAVSLMQGHIIDSENALMDDRYQASPDLSPSGVQSASKTLPVLIVPLLNKHGKPIGALRASRGKSCENADDSFSSVDSLVLCILGGLVQCTWNMSDSPSDESKRTTPVLEIEEASKNSTGETKNMTATRSDSTPPSQARPSGAWEKILRDAIVEFDLSHATVVSRLSNSMGRSNQHQRQREQQHRERDLRERDLRERDLRERELREQDLREQDLRERELREREREQQHREREQQQREREQPIFAPFSRRSAFFPLNVRDLSQYTPAVRPNEENRGVVSFVHHEY